ncbi:MAG: YdcF family protein [Frankia sp.]
MVGPGRPRWGWFRVRWWRWALRFVAAAVIFVVLVLGATAFQVWHVGREDSRPKSDTLVVLGASQYNGRPSEVFQARLAHARDLYQAGVAPRIITVGGSQRGDAYTEAQAGADWLAEHGVPRSALVAVGQGADTLVSLRAVAVTMNQHRWRTAVIVTDPWHSLRSRQMARDLHIKAVTSPVHTGPAVRGRGTEARYIGRETMGYLFYRLFHRASPPGAAPAAV